MDVSLVSFNPEGQRCDVQVQSPTTTVGRHLDCEIRVPHPNVSRRHFQLVFDGDRIKIKDLGSSNGTFLNDQRIQEAELAPGDKIKIADVVFTVVIDGVPAEITRQAATVPPPEEVLTLHEPGPEPHEPTHGLEEPPAAPAADDPLAALAAMSRQPSQ